MAAGNPTLARAPRLAGPSMAANDQVPVPVGFDVDAFHAMQARDNDLIRDQVLNGSVGKVFVYRFAITPGNMVQGISVEGAHHLANYYKGLQHTIVATMEKRGALFIFTTYPSPGIPGAINVAVLPELEHEDDFYRCVVEITDIKTGNKWQAEKSEKRHERRRDGSTFERPNFQVIAQSKARRNAILMAVPRDVQERFEQLCIQQGQSADITDDVMAEKRRAIVQFATSRGIGIDRDALAGLGMDQITGLREAAQNGVEAFKKAMTAVGLASSEQVDPETGEVKTAQVKTETKKAAPKGDAPKGEAKGDAPKGEQAQGEQTKTAETPKEQPKAEQTKSDAQADPAGDDDDGDGDDDGRSNDMFRRRR